MTSQFEFRRDKDGRPLWHAPLPNSEFDPNRPYQPNNSPFSTCQLCGEPWPCAEARYDAGPVSVEGIWLRNGQGNELEVLAQIDGVWRTVIRQGYNEGDLLSYIVEPLGMRHAKPDRLAAPPSEKGPVGP